MIELNPLPTSLVSPSIPQGLAYLHDFIYTKTPIVLENGIATKYLGGTKFGTLAGLASVVGATAIAPIILLTEPVNLILNILNGNFNLSSYEFKSDWVLMPGAQVSATQTALYPLMNLQMAANASIDQPLAISFKQFVPSKQAGDFVVKSAFDTAFFSLIDQHRHLGGTFTLLTQGKIYTNCVLQAITEDGSPTQQPMTQFRWDFIQPLITAQAVSSALATYYNAIDTGAYVG